MLGFLGLLGGSEAGILFDDRELCCEDHGTPGDSVKREPRPVRSDRVKERTHSMLLSRYENRWNPWKELESLQGQLSRLIGTPGETPLKADADEHLAVATWSPLVDIVEDDKEYLIKVEAPEVPKSALSVKVHDGVLHISGERKFEREDTNKRYRRVERSYGTFARSFTLPDDADAEKVNAEFKDGVLLVHVTKSEKSKPKQIDVKVS